MLPQYAELLIIGRAKLLSPLELRGRILAKGKVKVAVPLNRSTSAVGGLVKQTSNLREKLTSSSFRSTRGSSTREINDSARGTSQVVAGATSESNVPVQVDCASGSALIIDARVSINQISKRFVTLAEQRLLACTA
eukprot:3768166-Prymnesium_polylepis.1